MNVVRYAKAIQTLHQLRVTVYSVPDSPIWNAATQAGVPVKETQRGHKYFDWFRAYHIAKQFRRDQITTCIFRDTHDMDTLARAKRSTRQPFRLVYHQAMQLGLAKKDFLHTRRFKAIDAWIALLPYLKKQVAEMTHYPAERVHVVPLGIDATRLRCSEHLRSQARAHFGLEDRAFVVGLMGRLDPLKGQHTAIESLAQLRSRGSEAQLLLMGDATLHEGNTYHQRIHELIQTHQLGDAVKLAPGHGDVALFYHAIDAFALCSAGETFGNVTIEAMAMGLPIIGTNTSGTPEILEQGHCGALIPPHDAMALAAVIHQFQCDSNLRVRLGNRARERFNQCYTLQHSVAQLMQVIHDINTSEHAQG